MSITIFSKKSKNREIIFDNIYIVLYNLTVNLIKFKFKQLLPHWGIS